jgi:hypothetical protein
MSDLVTKEMVIATADLAGRGMVQELPVALMPAKVPQPQTLDTAAAASTHVPLFSEAEMEGFRSKWSKLQTDFVDEPRQTVEGADKLVANVMQRLAGGFAKERSGLEEQWVRGDNVSTEDLRVALQRHHSFFGKLLNLKEEDALG